MQPFDYAQAQNIDHAVNLLTLANGRARILSGGTDLIVALREGRTQTDLVVDIKRIPEANELSFDQSHGLRIGAAVSCQRIYTHDRIARTYPGLIDALSLIGGVQIQGRASVGGNLCNASPAADSIPALMVHAATCQIVAGRNRREVAVEEFCTAPGRTVLQANEFLIALHMPAPQPGFGAAYLRFIPRNEMDIAVVGVAAALQLDANRETIIAGRIALGAVAPTPLLVSDAAAALVGQPPTAHAFAHAAELARRAARPISDMRGTADYRRHLVGVLTLRALEQALTRARQS